MENLVHGVTSNGVSLGETLTPSTSSSLSDPPSTSPRSPRMDGLSRSTPIPISSIKACTSLGSSTSAVMSSSSAYSSTNSGGTSFSPCSSPVITKVRSDSTFISARLALSSSDPSSSQRWAGSNLTTFVRPVWSRSMSPPHLRRLTPQEKRALRVCGGGTGPLLGLSEIPEDDPRMTDVSFWQPYLHNIFRQNGIIPIDQESPMPSPRNRRGSLESEVAFFEGYGSDDTVPKVSSGPISTTATKAPRVEDLYIKAAAGTYPVFLVPNARMASRYEMVDNSDSYNKHESGLVVKFFGKNFNGASCHSVELAVYKLLRQAEFGPIGHRVPNLKAYGCLFTDEDKEKLPPEQRENFWSWPWIITTIIPGTSWGYMRGYVERSLSSPSAIRLGGHLHTNGHIDPGARASSLLAFKDELDLAGQLGELMHLLHMTPIEEVMAKSGDHPFSRTGSRGSFLAFLQRRREKATAYHRKKGSLPPKLIDQIEAYLPHEMTSLVPPISSLRDPPNTALTTPDRPMCLIHADIHGDHVMLRRNDWAMERVPRRKGSTDGRDVHSTASPSALTIEGLIDFGDARLGHPIYELTSIHTELFRSNKQLLRAYLEGYGWDMPMISVGAHSEEEGIDTPVGHSFVYLAMCHSLLHDQDLFKNVFKRHPELYAKVESLHELAEFLWNYEQP